MAMSLIKSFRRNRKAYFAGLTILTILAFVFIPPILESLSSFTRRDAVVVTSRYGKLKESELAGWVQDQHQFASFLQGVGIELERKKDFMAARQLQMVAGRMLADSRNEESAVRNWLLNRRGAELGIQVSHDAVREQLRQLTGGKLTDDEVRGVLGTKSGRGMSVSQLFSLMSRILLARRVEMLYSPAAAMTPEQDYEYFLQIQRKAHIEAVGMPVTQWTGEVKNPTDEVLSAFYEQYKEVPYSPHSATPGLKQPRRLNLRYMKADYAKVYDVKSVSEERIREYYQQNKEELYKEPDLPPITTPGKPDAKTETKPEAKSPTKPEAKPESKPESKPAAKAETKPEAKPAAKPEAKPAEKPGAKTSDARRGVKIHLVAEQKTAPAAPAPAAPAAPAKTDAAKPGAPALAAPAAPAKTDAAKPAGGLPKPPSAVAVDAKIPPTPPKYRPLEKVHDEIAATLARMDANKKIRDQLTAVQDVAGKYLTEKFSRFAEGESAAPLAEPDWAALAKQRGLTLHETGPVSTWDVAKLDIGGSVIEASGRAFAAYAFGSLRPTQAEISKDMDQNQYVFWIISDVPAAVGNLEDAAFKSFAVDAWKRVQARDIAKAKAAELARACRTAKKPLREALAAQKELKDLKVITPEPFSWYSVNYSSAQMFSAPLQLSPVTGVEGAGMEFMRAVFKMKPGDVETAWNEAQNVVYVVQLNEFSPRENTLWTEFMATQGQGLTRNQVQQLANDDLRRLFRDWSGALEKDAQLKWERKPYRGRGESEPTEEAPADDGHDHDSHDEE